MFRPIRSYKVTDFRKYVAVSIDDEDQLVIKILDYTYYEKVDDVKKCFVEAGVDKLGVVGCEGCLLTIETPEMIYRIDAPFSDIQDVATVCMNTVNMCRLKRN